MKYKNMVEKKKVFDRNGSNKNGLVKMHRHILDELKYIEQVENIENKHDRESRDWSKPTDTEAVLSFLIDRYWKDKNEKENK